MPSLIYVYDAYCGWCYGFARALGELNEDPDVDIRVIHGSLFSGASSRPIADFPHIPGANARISALTGAAFGQPYERLLADGSFVLDSDAAARGLTALKRLAGPERALEMAHAMQIAFYQDGQDLASSDTYAHIAELHGLEADAARELLNDPATAYAARAEQQSTADLGVQSYPTLLARTPTNLVRFGSPLDSSDDLRQQLITLDAASRVVPAGGNAGCDDESGCEMPGSG